LYGNIITNGRSTLFLQALGSTIKAQPLNGFEKISGAAAMGNQTVYYVPIKVDATFTCTGGYIYQGVQGDYTADNYNGIGLYSFNAGVLTLVASSTDDGTIWKATSQTWIQKAFSSTVKVYPGVYWLALLYCRSASVTGPQIAYTTNLYNAGVNVGLFTNSALYSAQKTATTSLAGSVNMSTLTQSVQGFYAALY
jgi:hypothetical protein